CPTSNELLGSGEAPIKQFIEHGLEFGLGTDSPASNPDMDLFVEARKARAILEKQLGQAKPQSEVSAALSPKRLIEMMTLGAARILGFADDLGSIDPGKRADFIILNHQDTASDPYDYLIETASKSLISQTILSGNIVYNR
ncbi:amidohydrolase family protein, partial [Candidatus Aquicultor secundus]